MHKTLGYLLTWTTYGTWLQGNKRGYVKDGVVVLGKNTPLANSNIEELKKDQITLTPDQRKIIANAIHAKANEIGQKICAISVCSNHVHIVADYTTQDLGLIVRYYKMAGQTAMRNAGLAGRLWTKGFDKRFCFDEQSLRKRIDYVNSQSK
jgi:REP element-mobilizing transposase RayT